MMNFLSFFFICIDYMSIVYSSICSCKFIRKRVKSTVPSTMKRRAEIEDLVTLNKKHETGLLERSLEPFNIWMKIISGTRLNYPSTTIMLCEFVAKINNFFGVILLIATCFGFVNFISYSFGIAYPSKTNRQWLVYYCLLRFNQAMQLFIIVYAPYRLQIEVFLYETLCTFGNAVINGNTCRAIRLKPF